MKNKYISIFLLLCAVLFTMSCSKMNDLHQPYLDEGEIIYAAKVDSVAPHSGNKRIQLEIFIKSQRIDKLRIYWNNYADSTDLEVGNKTGVMKKLIENMEEKSYLLNLVSFDKFGNKSLPFEVTGNVYGDNYNSALLTTTIDNMVYTYYDTIQVTLARTNENVLGYEMEYTPLGGNSAIQLKVNDIKKLHWTSGTSFNLGATIDPAQKVKWRTAYLPEVAAIDTFFTEWSDFQPPLVNPFMGIYTSTGKFTPPSSAARNFNLDKTLVAIDNLTCETTHSDLGTNGYKIRLKVNADNSVTVTQYNGSGAVTGEMVPGAVNTYNPATKTFTLNYQYNGSGGNRVISETLVKK